jgi:hypothetical protein
LVTLGFLLLRFPALDELERGEIAERLMRAHGVDVLPAGKLRIEMRDRTRKLELGTQGFHDGRSA